MACATLRYFYPDCACHVTSTQNNSAQNRLTASQPLASHLRPAAVRTYPNPVHEQVTLELSGLVAVRVKLVAAATGQVALSQALTGTEHAMVSVAGLAPGVYQGQLLSAAGTTVGTCKIVVIH